MSCSSLNLKGSRKPASSGDENCLSSIKDFLISTQYKQQSLVRMDEFRGAVLENLESNRISLTDGKKLSESLFLKQLKIDKTYKRVLLDKEKDKFTEKEIIEAFYEAFEIEFQSKTNILDQFAMVNRSYQVGIPITRRTRLLTDLGVPNNKDGRLFYLDKIMNEDIIGIDNINLFLREARFVHMDSSLLNKTVTKILQVLEENEYIAMAEAFKKATDKRVVLDSNYLFENLLSVLKIERGVKVPISNISSGMEFLAYIRSKQMRWYRNYDRIPFLKNLESKDEIISYLNSNRSRLRQLSYKEISEELSENIDSLSKYSLLKFDYYNNELYSHRVYDQCNWGSCWIQAPVAKFEIEVSKKLGQEVNISTDHFYLNIYRSRVIDYFLTSKKKLISEIGEGGFSVNVDSYARTFGLLPTSVWKPKTAFHDHGNKRIIQRKIQDLFSEFNTKAKDPELTAEQLSELKDRYVKKIDNEFDRMFGKPPARFEFNGKRYTAQTFYMENRKQGLHDGVVWNVKNRAEKYKNRTYTLPKYIRGRVAFDNVRLQNVTKNLDDLNAQIIKSIDRGRAVGAGFRWASGESYGKEGTQFIDNFTGIMTSPESIVGEKVNPRGGGHMVLIIGYELDGKGKIKRYKILNSWGHRKGDNGIYHMDVNYFKNFLRGLYLNKNDLLGDITLKQNFYRV